MQQNCFMIWANFGLKMLWDTAKIVHWLLICEFPQEKDLLQRGGSQAQK